jgi:hypothetical protein
MIQRMKQDITTVRGAVELSNLVIQSHDELVLRSATTNLQPDDVNKGDRYDNIPSGHEGIHSMENLHKIRLIDRHHN